jgi:hypothetical protein
MRTAAITRERSPSARPTGRTRTCISSNASSRFTPRPGERADRRGAEHIAALCARSFLHSATGALLEYFDADLKPAAGEEGRIVEPGHCFEWASLFEFLAQWDVPEALQISDGMTAFARRHGLDQPRGVAINEVMIDGAVRNAAARLWPQTERLQVALARYRRTGDEEERKEAAAAYAGLVKYFETPVRGAWRDKLKADGGFVEEPRARKLALPYHWRAGRVDGDGGRRNENGMGPRQGTSLMLADRPFLGPSKKTTKPVACMKIPSAIGTGN